MIENSYCTLTGEDIYQWQRLPEGRWYLKDVNRSRTWRSLYKPNVLQGALIGYVIKRDKLYQCDCDIADGKVKPGEPKATGLTLTDLSPCGITEAKIKLLD